MLNNFLHCLACVDGDERHVIRCVFVMIDFINWHWTSRVMLPDTPCEYPVIWQWLERVTRIHRQPESFILNICTVYPKKYAHSFCFAVLCCGYALTDFPISIRLTSLALWQSNDCPSASKATLMNTDKYFMWIHYERLHNHNKAKHNKTVCIFLGIYCIFVGTTMTAYRLHMHKHSNEWRMCMMTSSNGNIFRVTGHLCGEFTGPRWIPHTKASDAKLWCLLWSAPESTVE